MELFCGIFQYKRFDNILYVISRLDCIEIHLCESVPILPNFMPFNVKWRKFT